MVAVEIAPVERGNVADASEIQSGFFPGRAEIEAYGNGGFRFAGMSHRGSILCLPSGIRAWSANDGATLDPAMFADVMAEREDIGFLLLGTGVGQIFPSREVRALFRDAGMGLDPMSTGAACRTYNILLGERRPVAAALIAVA
jgi:uncharacterized protein